MRKLLFAIVIFALFSLVACADSSSTPMDPVNPDNIFGTEDLAEDEVLTISVHADEIVFDSIEEMLHFVEISGIFRIEVVRVEILDERTEWHNPALVFQHEEALPYLSSYHDPALDDLENFKPYTFHRIQVLEVFKGEVEAGDILEVTQMGGQIDNVRLESTSFVPLSVGDDLVLFLTSPLWIPASPRGIIGSTQAAYRFPASGGELMALSADVALESVNPTNELTLTIGDLRQIADGTFGR
ncbi:MAG: hypothetical protein FWD99_03405 [Oscillospiraceae bacterium]|nr:hypothetical protein [Oscillospiraceae bacterium]